MACLQLSKCDSYDASPPDNSSARPSFLQLHGFCSSPFSCCLQPLARQKLHNIVGRCKSSSLICTSLARSFSCFPARSSFVCTPLVARPSDSAGQCRSHRRPSRLLLCFASEVSYPEDKKIETVYDGQHKSQPTAMVHSTAEQKLNDCISFTAGILEMSRLQNVLPSMALVFLGSWMAAGRNMSVFWRSSVWITAICSALIAVASMLANDIFDYRSGVDGANGKSTPLLQGQVHSDDVELVAGCLYGAVVIGLCVLEPVNLRLLIGGAAIATYIYTPFLKKLTVVKNLLVSGVISSSILAGALVIAGKVQLDNRIIAVALFLFLCSFSREVLMDVQDIVGDRAAGVKTLAVRFGGRIGTLTAGIGLAAANALLIAILAVRANAFAMIGTFSLLPLHATILRLNLRKGVSGLLTAEKSVKQIIEQSMIHIGLGVLVLASAA